MSDKNTLVGHNGDVTENTFFHHFREWEDLQRQKSAIAGKIGQLKKRMKDDGIVVKDFEEVLSLRAMTVEDQVASFNAQLSYMNFMKMPIAAHMQFIDQFDDETNMTDEQRREKWDNEGYVSGRAGLNRDVCPHDPNSEAGRLWMAGYDRGQKENAEPIKKKSAAAKAKPKAKDDGPDEANGDATPDPDPEPVGDLSDAGKGGVTYWHNAEAKQVYERKVSDPDPKGAVPITRAEYDKLVVEYTAAEAEEWDKAGQAEDAAPPPGATVN